MFMDRSNPGIQTLLMPVGRMAVIGINRILKIRDKDDVHPDVPLPDAGIRATGTVMD